jgi:hypothetical protein
MQNPSNHSGRIIDLKALHCDRGLTCSEKMCCVSEKGLAHRIVCSYMHEKRAKNYVQTAFQNVFPESEGRDELNFLVYIKYMHTEKYRA